jgi:D-aminoacyl-tRNA deacylase
MCWALILLKRYARGMDFKVSFECTHHGPHVRTPCFFIEIGSDETAWSEPAPGAVLARAILSLGGEVQTSGDTIAIGVGGGHYAPRHTDLVTKRCVSMGHIVPSHALGDLDDDMIKQAIENTPGCEAVYFHRKAMKGGEYRMLKEKFESRGIKAIRSSDVELRALDPD